MLIQFYKNSEVVKCSIVKLCFGMVVTGVLALSAHVVMQEILLIPFPRLYPKTGVIHFLDYSYKLLATICFYRLSSDRFLRFSLPVRCLVLFVLIAMLNEKLIRMPLMVGVTTSEWVLSLIYCLPDLMTHFLLACLIVTAAPKLGRVWQQLLGALFIAALLNFWFTPAISKYVDMVLAQLPPPANIISPPYDLNVLIPAYLSFAEPVIACFILARIVWSKLSLASVKGMSLFVLLIMSMRGVLFAPFIYIFYANLPPLTAILSMGQFSLEALVLALMTAITLRHSSTHLPGLGRPSEA